jgi:hypothetical protein
MPKVYGWAAAWVVAVVLDSEAEVEVVLAAVVAVVAVVGAVVVVAEEPHATANRLTARSRSTTTLHMRTRRGLNADIGKSTSHFVFRLALRRSNTRITAESEAPDLLSSPFAGIGQSPQTITVDAPHSKH